ncbi:MAG: DUF151 domain-containing protein [Bdellovibrionales bacterium]|nr:DUF151 domain-containing protein [Bdellovibrionales bacterium]
MKQTLDLKSFSIDLGLEGESSPHPPSNLEEKIKVGKDWIELEPYGLTASADATRPVMLFKSKKGEEILPVWLSPLDAGIAITQHQVKSPSLSPHDLTLKILQSLGVHLESCVFTEVKGHHQYVQLNFSGSRKLKYISARADQAISFSLQAKAKFFCGKNYIKDSRVLNAEMSVVLQDLRDNPSSGKNRHPYLN